MYRGVHVISSNAVLIRCTQHCVTDCHNDVLVSRISSRQQCVILEISLYLLSFCNRFLDIYRLILQAYVNVEV